MNLLDENIRQDQAEQLRKRRLPFRYLTAELARTGVQDTDVIPWLHRTNQPTFFTHDQDFFKRELIHPRYCIAWLDVFDGKAAQFIRAFLVIQLSIRVRSAWELSLA